MIRLKMGVLYHFALRFLQPFRFCYHWQLKFRRRNFDARQSSVPRLSSNRIPSTYLRPCMFWFECSIIQFSSICGVLGFDLLVYLLKMDLVWLFNWIRSDFRQLCCASVALLFVLIVCSVDLRFFWVRYVGLSIEDGFGLVV